MPTAAGPLCIVSHTHWDREWYCTAEAFRTALVPLVDDVVTFDGPFLLDGQAIVLEDYGRWRPERVELLRQRLRSGEVEAGPWYVLADNLMPSGEALVRNLLAGARALGDARAHAPHVLYCPDSFGHPAAGPALAAGFGLALAIVWRGYGGRGWPSGDAARWRSAGGEEVQLHHLPPSGYEHGSALPVDGPEAREHWLALHETLASRASGAPMLLLNGADHHARQANLAAAVEFGRRVLGDAVDITTLAAFAALRRNAMAGLALPVVRGELRSSPSYVWSLQGTFGSRAHQKRANAHLERLLTRELEPWTAVAWWTGGVDLQFAERALWRLALASHPHDTLCGCSIDAVAQAMDDRIARARDGAHAARRTALHAIVGLDADLLRPAFSDVARSVLLTNPVPRRRRGVVEIDVEIPLANVAVGFGSAGRSASPRAVPSLAIGDLPIQRVRGTRDFARHDAPHHYPRTALVQRERVLAWVDDLPPLGTRVVPIRERRSRARSHHSVAATAQGLENGTIRVWWDDTRGLCCANAFGEWRGLLAFETVGDAGDLYTHSAIPETHRTAAPRRARVTLRGPLRGELALSAVVPVAGRTLSSATGEPIVRFVGKHRIDVRVQLDAGASWFRVILSGTNNQMDQRLRAVIRTGCRSTSHVADAAMGAVRRSSGAPAYEAGDVEIVPGTAPLHRWVSLFDGDRGCTIVSDGLAEYEATELGDVAVTLVRSVGELSRADLAERPGHAGWPSATPLAQCLSPWQSTLAFLPHGRATDATWSDIEHCCEDVLVPASGTTIVPLAPGDTSGPELQGAGLSFLACKRSDDALDLVVRCINRGDAWAEGRWSLAGMTHAWLARLDETPRGALAVHEGAVRFAVAPHATATLRLRRAPDVAKA